MKRRQAARGKRLSDVIRNVNEALLPRPAADVTYKIPERFLRGQGLWRRSCCHMGEMFGFMDGTLGELFETWRFLCVTSVN